MADHSNTPLAPRIERGLAVGEEAILARLERLVAMHEQVVEEIQRRCAYMATETITETETAETPERYAWLVFRVDDKTEDGKRIWLELGEVAVEHSYSRPSPQQLGEKWGDGEYMFFRVEPDHPRPYDVETVTVVETVYYEAAKQEEAA